MSAANATTTEGAALLPVRFILNTYYSGPQAWFFLADDRGYFRDEGLEVIFTEGTTMARTVSLTINGDFDVGYGDMNELIRMAAEGNQEPPIAVMAIHNRPPYTIAVTADGPIRTAKDLAGKRLISHHQDAAWLLFPEFCRATGLDPDSVDISFSDLTHAQLAPQLLDGTWDGMFGFVNTINANAMIAGIDPEVSLRHLTWHDQVPGLYGGALMVTRSFLAKHPDAVGGLVRAVNRGLVDTIDDIDAAIDAVVRRNPRLDRVANRARLVGTLALEMGHAEAQANGLGDADHERLREAAHLIAETKGYANVPTPEDVFLRDFLPAPELRARPHRQ